MLCLECNNEMRAWPRLHGNINDWVCPKCGFIFMTNNTLQTNIADNEKKPNKMDGCQPDNLSEICNHGCQKEPNCWNCAEAKREGGLTYAPCDRYIYDLPCAFKIYYPPEKPEWKFGHKRIQCPQCRYDNELCSGLFKLYGYFNPCPDCPVNWKLMRL